MRINRASILGALSRHLGIDPDARVVVLPTRTGLAIWELDKKLIVTIAATGECSSRIKKPLPPELKSILEATDHELQDWVSGDHLRFSFEDRETIHSELQCRGIEAEGRTHCPDNSTKDAFSPQDGDFASSPLHTTANQETATG
jgi:hypothetical protein